MAATAAAWALPGPLEVAGSCRPRGSEPGGAAALCPPVLVLAQLRLRTPLPRYPRSLPENATQLAARHL